jgi:hypothetical protein
MSGCGNLIIPRRDCFGTVVPRKDKERRPAAIADPAPSISEKSRYPQRQREKAPSKRKRVSKVLNVDNPLAISAWQTMLGVKHARIRSPVAPMWPTSTGIVLRQNKLLPKSSLLRHNLGYRVDSNLYLSARAWSCSRDLTTFTNGV